MTQSYDVIVVGLGAFGSAAVEALARRGRRVVGIDRFRPPHDRGSTHGGTRIIRQAYAEDPLYVPLLQDAYRRWAELEERSGTQLLVETGGLMLGPPDGELVDGARIAAEAHELPFEELDAGEIRRRWPAVFAPTEGHVAVFDPRAGFLRPEAAVESCLRLAADAGAELRLDTRVAGLSGDGGGDGVRVTLSGGEVFRARRAVLAAGPWTAELIPGLAGSLDTPRQVQHWFAPRGDAGRLRPESLPIYVWEHDAKRIFYGFPDIGDGLKVAIHHEGEPADPSGVERDVAPAEAEALRPLLDRYLPGVAGPWLRSSVCLYTNTPDGHFLIDHHPEVPAAILASPCSGHGFKFMSALGEVLADLADDVEPAFDLEPFSIARLADRRALADRRVRASGPRFDAAGGADRSRGG